MHYGFSKLSLPLRLISEGKNTQKECLASELNKWVSPLLRAPLPLTPPKRPTPHTTRLCCKNAERK